jgi:hypothetical protein
MITVWNSTLKAPKELTAETLREVERDLKIAQDHAEALHRKVFNLAICDLYDAESTELVALKFREIGTLREKSKEFLARLRVRLTEQSRKEGSFWHRVKPTWVSF